MPVIIRRTKMKYKDSNNRYVGVDAIAERSTSELLEDIEAKGQEVSDEIESKYSTLISDVNRLNVSKVSRPLTNPNGTAGQILRTNGDGTTTWAAAASQQEVTDAVGTWLDTNIPTGQTVLVDPTFSTSGAAADAEETGNRLDYLDNTIEQGLHEIRKNIYMEEEFDDSVEGYLSTTGNLTESLAYTIKKYEVTPGEVLEVKIEYPFESTGGVFQFQNSADIPLQSNSYIIGSTYTDAYDGTIIVPEGATWLMISVRNNVDNNIILRSAPILDDLDKKVDKADLPANRVADVFHIHGRRVVGPSISRLWFCVCFEDEYEPEIGDYLSIKLLEDYDIRPYGYIGVDLCTTTEVVNTTPQTVYRSVEFKGLPSAILENGKTYTFRYNGITYDLTSRYLIDPSLDKLIDEVLLNAKEYDQTATYEAGECCIYGGDYWMCTIAVTTPETFNTDHWKKPPVFTQWINSKADKIDTILNTTLSRGRKTNSTVGAGSFAFGNNVESSGYYSHAEGVGTISSGRGSHAEGTMISVYDSATGNTDYFLTASGNGSHAEGIGTVASGSGSHSEGYLTQATGTNSHAEGSETIASGMHSHTEGTDTKAFAESSHAEGSGSRAAGLASHSEGGTTLAAESASYSHAEGNQTVTRGVGSHAEGVGAEANGRASHAEGNFTLAGGLYSHAQGDHNHAPFKAMFAGGSYSVIPEAYPEWQASHEYVIGDKVSRNDMGYECKEDHTSTNGFDTTKWNLLPAAGDAAFVFGNGVNSEARSNAMEMDWDGNVKFAGNAKANGATYGDVVSRGRKADTTVGEGSFAFGYKVEASKVYSHAEGYTTKASGAYSHAEGNTSVASGSSSHAEGNRTTASGNSSHADGLSTVASGMNSHASGRYTEANANCMFAIGLYNKLADLYPNWTAGVSYVVGDRVMYNGFTIECIVANSDTSYDSSHWKTINGQINSDVAFVVGNGTDDNNRSNAMEVYWDGTVKVQTALKIGNTIITEDQLQRLLALI